MQLSIFGTPGEGEQYPPFGTAEIMDFEFAFRKTKSSDISNLVLLMFIYYPNVISTFNFG